MPRIVALDVGDATIGIAASDELNISVNPITTIRRSNSVKADLIAVEEVVRQLDASKVVIGIPLDSEGRQGIQANKVKEFSNRLARRLRLPIEFIDESYSTIEAEAAMLEFDISRAKRRKVIDQAAAVVILRDYLRAQEEKR